MGHVWHVARQGEALWKDGGVMLSGACLACG